MNRIKWVLAFLFIFNVSYSQIQIAKHKASGLPADTSSMTISDMISLRTVLDNIKVRMDDWPQLNYYRADNQRIIKSAIYPETIFLGDSIFEYWADPKISDFFSNQTILNRGISAQTTPQILLRLHSDVINLKPKVMVLLAGINDIGANTGPITLEESAANIASIIELAAVHNIKVIICSLLPVSDYHFDGKDPRGSQIVKRPLEKISALNQWIRNYAQNHNLIYIDCYTVLVDEHGKLRCELSDDDLHPNKQGYAMLEPLMIEAISKAFSSLKLHFVRK